jgi:hypothetical protein
MLLRYRNSADFFHAEEEKQLISLRISDDRCGFSHEENVW